LNNNGEIETSKVVSSNNYQNGAKISIKDNETINIYNSNDTINKGKTIKNYTYNKNTGNYDVEFE
jgi:hypothetical protein